MYSLESARNFCGRGVDYLAACKTLAKAHPRQQVKRRQSDQDESTSSRRGRSPAITAVDHEAAVAEAGTHGRCAARLSTPTRVRVGLDVEAPTSSGARPSTKAADGEEALPAERRHGAAARGSAPSRRARATPTYHNRARNCLSLFPTGRRRRSRPPNERRRHAVAPRRVAPSSVVLVREPSDRTRIPRWVTATTRPSAGRPRGGPRPGSVAASRVHVPSETSRRRRRSRQRRPSRP